jgi:hypothetical protein
MSANPYAFTGHSLLAKTTGNGRKMPAPATKHRPSGRGCANSPDGTGTLCVPASGGNINPEHFAP